MRFGSVEFFKVLIKTVLAILFFVPLIIAVIFGVFLVKKNNELNSVQQENLVLIGEKAGTADDFYDIFSKSGVSYEELVALMNKNKNLDAEGLYKLMSELGLSDADIIAAAAAKRTVNAESFYGIMSKNGITDKDLMLSVLKRHGGNADGFYELLKQCGLSDAEIAELISKGSSKPPESTGSDSNSSGNSGSEPTSEPNSAGDDSPYAAIHTDMQVAAPAEYVREQGTIYMTFDDGPSKNTYSILYILRQQNIKATFFVVPDRSEECAALLKAIVAEGHSIGVHSASHKYEKIYASVEAYLEDFYEAWDIIRDATGVSTPIFRFPGGSKNDYDEATRDAIIKEMTRRGFRFYDWNVESGDIGGADWSQMYNSIPTDVKSKYRSVVLMHDTSYNAVLVLEDVIKVLKGEGYKFDKINDDTMPIQFIGPFS